jgi:hypothetical protein
MPSFCQHMLGCHHWHTDPSLDSILAATLNKRSKHTMTIINLLAHKQQKSCSTLLVIPHSDLPHCLHSQTIVHFIQKFGFVCSKEAKALAA